MTEPDPLRAPGESPRPPVPVSQPLVPPGPVQPSPDFGPSPYQSPAILPDEEPALAWDGDPVQPLPIAAAVLFAAIASGITVAGASLAGMMMHSKSPWAFVFGPLVLVGLFVLAAIVFYSNNPLLISKSTGWKILMVLLVPPVSMLVFVPTCVGSTMFMMPFVFRRASSEWLMLVPVFIAYFVCAVIISRRLRWLFKKHPDPNGSSRWLG